MSLRVSLQLFVLIAVQAFAAPHSVAQDKIWRIGFLDLGTPPTAENPSANLSPFLRGLGELGYAEGRNYVIDARFADTDRSRLPTLAKELVDHGVDVIVTIGTPTVGAAKGATTTIPIIMAGSQNPVENGFVSSLARPGGNVTGLTHNPGPDVAGKALHWLKEIAPQISRVAVLVASGGGFEPSIEVQHAVAEDLNLPLLVHDITGVKNAADFDVILSNVVEEGADALFAYPEFVVGKYRGELLKFLSTQRLPSAFQEAIWVEEGGLLSYYTSFPELRRQAASYVDKIFKGARPAELPVAQPSRFHLALNLKTAKGLGLTVPPHILAFADQIID